jgi:hypothetical protein
MGERASSHVSFFRPPCGGKSSGRATSLPLARSKSLRFSRAPFAFAKELQNAGYALPRNSVNAHPAGALTLAKDNGDPTAPIAIQRLKDGQTANPLDRSGALLPLPDQRACRLHPAGRQTGHQLRELGQPPRRPRQLLADRHAHLAAGARARLQSRGSPRLKTNEPSPLSLT